MKFYPWCFLVLFIQVASLALVFSCSSTPKQSKSKPQGFLILEKYPSAYVLLSETEYDLVANDIDNSEGEKKLALVREYAKLLYAAKDWDRFFGLAWECKNGSLAKLCPKELNRLEVVALIRLCQMDLAEKILFESLTKSDPYFFRLNSMILLGKKNLPPPRKLENDSNQAKTKYRIHKWPQIDSAKIPLKLRRVKLENRCEALS